METVNLTVSDTLQPEPNPVADIAKPLPAVQENADEIVYPSCVNQHSDGLYVDAVRAAGPKGRCWMRKDYFSLLALAAT